MIVDYFECAAAETGATSCIPCSGLASENASSARSTSVSAMRHCGSFICLLHRSDTCCGVGLRQYTSEYMITFVSDHAGQIYTRAFMSRVLPFAFSVEGGTTAPFR